MMNADVELIRCPCCGRRSSHTVVRERVLAPAYWCRSCFGVWYRDGEAGHPALSSLDFPQLDERPFSQ